MKRLTPGCLERVRTGLLLLALCCGVSSTCAQDAQAPSQAPSAAAAAVVVQPRAYGYYVGDLLQQRVLLDGASGHFRPAALPAAERLGVWFERRESVIETDAGGDRWLRVEYQLVNAPQEASTVSLPAWELASAQGGASLRVPAWLISVNPISPRNAFDAPGLGDLRPDRPVPLADTVVLARALRYGLALLGVNLLAWAGWWLWRNRRDAAHLPFARASRQVRALDRADRQAWIIVHRAIDLSAGLTIHRGNLDLLFARAPFLRGAQPSIERFFEQSGEIFYGAGSALAQGEAHRLCETLRRLERSGTP